MSRLEVHLLGGFEVRLGDRRIQSFESQKVRALFAYLTAHGTRSFSRDHLASLLWSEKPDEAARRNLRQALHNLRSAFAAAGAEKEVLQVSHKELRVSPEIECWIDAERFNEAVRRGFTEGGPDPYQLTQAASLYTGEFLAGFYIKDSPPFEDWVVTEQERLRDAAIEAFRTLIGAYLRRGEYRLGIQYARRLLALDPLSESAHRYLMQLYSLAGRRPRALAQYESLRNLLNEELGVEPLDETTELFRAILTQEVPSSAEEEREDEPIAPLIPLVGRREAHERLEESWQAVLEGSGRVTGIEGEAGIGKTRLAKSFVDAATSKRAAVVLRGRSYDRAPLVSYRPFAEILLSAFADVLPEDSQELLQRLPAKAAADLLAVAPRLAQVFSELKDVAANAKPEVPGRLIDSLLQFLELLASTVDSARGTTPVILMMDDFQWADPASKRLLGELAGRLADRPIWVLCVCRDSGEVEGCLSGAPGDGPTGDVHRVRVGRLGSSEIREIAASMVGAAEAEELAAFLEQWGKGLPLAAAELINFLWDEGRLVPQAPGRWSLQGDLSDLSLPDDLKSLVQLRIRRLPTSARRLLAIAAILGQQFDAELVQIADTEHVEVVDICIQLMLERWLIRQFPVSWSRSRRERDVVLWARGARRGSFEFAHEQIREAILADVNPLRQQIMHRTTAGALRSQEDRDLESFAESLAYHCVEAGEWADALPWLEASAERAERIGALEAAAWYYEKCAQAVDRIAGSARGDAKKELAKQKERFAASLERIGAAPA